MQYCGICRGARVVRHAWQRQFVAVNSGDIASEPREVETRTYPCPECAPQDNINRVAVIDVQSRAVLQYEGSSSYKDYIHGLLANYIANELLAKGYIAFTEGKENTIDGTREWRAKVGVVSPAQVATMEERIAQRQEVVASAVVDEAVKYIRNWGSDFNWTSIEKNRAEELVRQALGDVIKRAKQEYSHR